MMKKIFNVILTLLVQVLLLAIVYNGAVSVKNLIIEPVRGNLNWGITLEIGLYVFVIIALINIITILFTKGNKRHLIRFVFLILYTTFMLSFNDLSTTPYLATFFLVASLVGLAGGDLITQLLLKYYSSKKRERSK